MPRALLLQESELPKHGNYIVYDKSRDGDLFVVHIYPSNSKNIYATRLPGSLIGGEDAYGVYRGQRFRVYLVNLSDSLDRGDSDKFKIGLMLLAGYIIPKLDECVVEAGVVVEPRIEERYCPVVAYAVTKEKGAVACCEKYVRDMRMAEDESIKTQFGRVYRNGGQLLIVTNDGVWCINEAHQVSYSKLVNISDALAFPELIQQLDKLA